MVWEAGRSSRVLLLGFILLLENKKWLIFFFGRNLCCLCNFNFCLYCDWVCVCFPWSSRNKRSRDPLSLSSVWAFLFNTAGPLAGDFWLEQNPFGWWLFDWSKIPLAGGFWLEHRACRPFDWCPLLGEGRPHLHPQVASAGHCKVKVLIFFYFF